MQVKRTSLLTPVQNKAEILSQLQLLIKIIEALGRQCVSVQSLPLWKHCFSQSIVSWELPSTSHLQVNLWFRGYFPEHLTYESWNRDFEAKLIPRSVELHQSTVSPLTNPVLPRCLISIFPQSFPSIITSCIKSVSESVSYGNFLQ